MPVIFRRRAAVLRFFGRDVQRRFVRALGVAIALACGAAGCGPAAPGYEALSLLGDTLRAPAIEGAARDGLDQRLAEARSAFDRAPRDLDSIIWLGRRTAYLGRYREAIDIFTEGLRHHPGNPRLLRHRGHRWISVRELDSAVLDLATAARGLGQVPDRIEEDGLPNPAGIPTSTLHTNIWYHLGLAYYLRGEFSLARAAYDQGLAASTNADMAVAFQYWMALVARRTGDSLGLRAVLAGVDLEAELLENHTYRRLLIHFLGRVPADAVVADEDAPDLDVTAAYGVAAWRMFGEGIGAADPLLRRIVTTSSWPSFGFIAAEAELARLRTP